MSGVDCSTSFYMMLSPGSCRLQSQSVGSKVCLYVCLCTEEWWARRAHTRKRTSRMGQEGLGGCWWAAQLSAGCHSVWQRVERSSLWADGQIEYAQQGCIIRYDAMMWLFGPFRDQFSKLRLLDEDPRWPDSHHWRARSLVRLQQRQEARKALKMAQLCAEERVAALCVKPLLNNKHFFYFTTYITLGAYSIHKCMVTVLLEAFVAFCWYSMIWSMLLHVPARRKAERIIWQRNSWMACGPLISRRSRLFDNLLTSLKCCSSWSMSF